MFIFFNILLKYNVHAHRKMYISLESDEFPHKLNISLQQVPRSKKQNIISTSKVCFMFPFVHLGFLYEQNESVCIFCAWIIWLNIFVRFVYVVTCSEILPITT